MATKPAHILLVISDLHMTEGVRLADGSVNLYEEFREDGRFASFLEYHEKHYPKVPIELIINGDFFDFLRMPKLGTYPDVMYEALACQEIKSFIDGHEEFFAALREFLSRPKNTLVCIIGESDCGLQWPGVQDIFRQMVSSRVSFRETSYRRGALYFEHGNQYDEISWLPKKRFVQDRASGISLLNLPWSAFFIGDYIVPVRQMRPQFSKVRPLYAYFIWMLIFDIGFAFKMIFRFVAIFFNKRLVRYSLGYGLMRSFQIIKRAAFRKGLSYHAEEILKSSDIQTVFFAHSHLPLYKRFKSGKEYINTGTWTNTISLDIRRFGRHTMLTYALVEIDRDERAVIRLMNWRGYHTPVRDFI